MANELVVVAAWDFNGEEGTTAPCVGKGRLALTGATSLLLAGGVGSYDPERHLPPNHCVGIYSFPSQGRGSESAGVAFFIPTTGHGGVRIGFDVYPDVLSSRWIRLQWTVDGGESWRSSGAGEAGGQGLYDLNTAAWHHFEAELSSDSEVDDNPAFGFRLVSTFSPGNSIYEACGSHNPYSRFGLMYVDMVTVRARRRG